MSNLSSLRLVSDAADAAFFAARDAFQAACDVCAADYSAERWDAMLASDATYRAARAAMDRANAALEHAELVSVGVRKAA